MIDLYLNFLIELSINKRKNIIHKDFGRNETSIIHYILYYLLKDKNIEDNTKWPISIFNNINTYKIKEKDYKLYFSEIKEIFFRIYTFYYKNYESMIYNLKMFQENFKKMDIFY